MSLFAQNILLFFSDELFTLFMFMHRRHFWVHSRLLFLYLCKIRIGIARPYTTLLYFTTIASICQYRYKKINYFFIFPWAIFTHFPAFTKNYDGIFCPFSLKIPVFSWFFDHFYGFWNLIYLLVVFIENFATRLLTRPFGKHKACLQNLF